MLLLNHGLDQLGDVTEGSIAGLRACQHQRDEGLIDHHGIGLIDNRHIGFGAHLISAFGDELIAQHIETELIDRAKDHVPGVDIPPLIAGELLGNCSVGDAEEIEHRAHPLIITSGQVGVHGDHMHALALQGITHRGHGSGQGLALARAHLHYIAGQEAQGALHLHVERRKAQGAARYLAHHAQQLGFIQDLAFANQAAIFKLLTHHGLCRGFPQFFFGGLSVTVSTSLCHHCHALLLILVGRRPHRFPEPVKCHECGLPFGSFVSLKGL